MCQGEIKFQGLCVKAQQSLNFTPASELVNSILFFVNWKPQACLITVYFYVKLTANESAGMLQIDMLQIHLFLEVF